MPHPKKKHTKSRSKKRQSHNALMSATITACLKCKKLVRTHHACTFCGDYKGATRLKPAKAKKK